MKLPWLTETALSALEIFVLRPPFLGLLLPVLDLGMLLYLHLREGGGLARVLWTVGVLIALFWNLLFIHLGWVLAVEKLVQGLTK
jgi:hypothetical protein